MKKSTKIILSVFLLIILITGGFVGNMFGIFSAGNYKNCETSLQENSPLFGKTVIFLGSSVTYGYGSLGKSFADLLEETDGITAIKEAVSGTTLADNKESSYVSRLKTVDKNIKADAFVCQLSTNDATKNIPLGCVTGSKNQESFDTKTVAGAIEYIISYVNDTWKCPVVFYTQAKYDSESYEKMVSLLWEIQKKWDIEIIDLWNNENINSITEEQIKLYLVDNIHPTRAGYFEWWLPEFQARLKEIL